MHRRHHQRLTLYPPLGPTDRTALHDFFMVLHAVSSLCPFSSTTRVLVAGRACARSLSWSLYSLWSLIGGCIIKRPWLAHEFQRYPENSRIAIVAHPSWVTSFLAMCSGARPSYSSAVDSAVFKKIFRVRFK